VTNGEFTATLGQRLHRPAFFPVPRQLLELVYGEMARATLLASARVMPDRLLAGGFVFRQPDIVAALRHVVGSQETAS
jgi:NAD dependent epimerase/dehydratase family enzyme